MEKKSKKITGTLPIETEGIVLDEAYVNAERERQFQENLNEIKQDIPNTLAEKEKEIPDDEREKIIFAINNNILPPSALEDYDRKKSGTQDSETVSGIGYEDEKFQSSEVHQEPFDDNEWNFGFEEIDDGNEPEKVSDSMGMYEIVSATPNETVFRKYIHDKPVLTKFESKKLRTITDEAEFDRFLATQKQKYKEKVTIPLVNSGISIDMIGAGALDHVEIYSTEPEQLQLTDILKRMRIAGKHIVNVSPKIPGDKLLANISYMDYQLVSFGFAAATTPEIDIPSTCDAENCNTAFVARTKTIETLLNGDEIENRWKELMLIPENERDYKKTATVDMFDGFMKFIIEIPSYEKVKRDYTSINEAVNLRKLDEDARDLAPIIINIVSIEVDDVISDTSIRIYKILKTLSTEELDTLRETIAKIFEDIIAPEFGIKVNCPKCGKENTIHISSVDEMVFYHLWAGRLLKRVESQRKAMMNGSQNTSE